MVATLVLLTVLIAMVTMVIGDSIARAFSLVGALAIVRFRTVVEDTRDTAFVIFAVAVGMAAGAGFLKAALVGLPFAAAAAFLFRPPNAPGERLLRHRVRHRNDFRADRRRDLFQHFVRKIHRPRSGRRKRQPVDRMHDRGNVSMSAWTGMDRSTRRVMRLGLLSAALRTARRDGVGWCPRAPGRGPVALRGRGGGARRCRARRGPCGGR